MTTKSASLDEVLLILNDHIDEPAVVEITVIGVQSGAGTNNQFVAPGVLRHWSSDEEAMEANRRRAAGMDRRRAANTAGWQARSMERLRAVYSVGDVQLDLWALSRSYESEAEWQVERDPFHDDCTAEYEVQLWLADPTLVEGHGRGGVSLSIFVGVEPADDEDT